MKALSVLSFESIGRRAWKVWRRNLLTFLKTWRVNFIPPFLEPMLYLFALGFGVGSYIDQVEGIPYVRFIAPGLISISIMNASFFECTYSSYVRMHYQRIFDAMIATPITIEEVIAGELMWGATRSLIYTILMLPVFIGFGVVDLPSSLLVIPFAPVAGLLFAAIGMCFTAITPNIEALNYPSFLFITPMFLFSGTFFPLSMLPEPLQVIALSFLPLTHVVILIRSMTLNLLSASLVPNMIWILGVEAILCVLAISLMKKRLIV
ncbi:MAG: ABC transporter permease [Methanomicrobiales archaeon]|nr:ABC transporter permease [Methanomicrobiales archaeon]